jgi:PilZ domain
MPAVALYSKQIFDLARPAQNSGTLYLGRSVTIQVTVDHLADDKKLRRSGRIVFAVPVELVGTDVYGQEFWEETKTAVVSRYGAAVISRRKLVPQQEMTIRRLDTNKEAEIRIVAKVSEEKDGYVYGVGFTNPEIDFWEMKFPDPPQVKDDTHSVTLACGSCHTREQVQAGEIALGVLDDEQGVSRFCQRCQTSTRWRPWQPDATTAPPPTAPASSQSQPPPPARANTRKDVRAKVNARACIRAGNFSDEVVCQDMSRGGLCFDSHKRYSLGEEVQVAVPFSPGVENLFVPARIAHVRKLPDKNVFRHGAAYLRDRRATSPL